MAISQKNKSKLNLKAADTMAITCCYSTYQLLYLIQSTTI